MTPKFDTPFAKALHHVTLNPADRAGVVALDAVLADATEDVGHLPAMVRQRLNQGWSRDWWLGWLQEVRLVGFPQFAERGRKARLQRMEALDDQIVDLAAVVRTDAPVAVMARLAPMMTEAPGNKVLRGLAVIAFDRLLTADPLACLAAVDRLVSETDEPLPPALLQCMANMGVLPEPQALLSRMDDKWGSRSPSGRLRRLMRCVGGDVVNLAADPSIAVLSLAVAAAVAGDTAAMQQHCADVLVAPDLVDAAGLVERVRQLQPLPPGSRVLVDESSLSDAIKTDARPGETLVLVLRSLTGGLSLPIVALDHMLAERGAGAIYLADHSLAGYALGVRSLGTDMATTISALTALIAARAPNRVVVLAVSGGGAAGIMLGLWLNAARALHFGSALNAEADFRASIGDIRSERVCNRARAAIGRDVSARVWYDRLPARPLTRLICSADRMVDLAHANQLKDMDNVEVMVMPNGYGHVQTMTMWRKGELGAQLDWLLA
jgi:hypothetical protein